MPTGIVAQIMGHAPNATAERHYKARPLELLAIWHSKYEAWLLEQAGIRFDGTAESGKLRLVPLRYLIGYYCGITHLHRQARPRSI